MHKAPAHVLRRLPLLVSACAQGKPSTPVTLKVLTYEHHCGVTPAHAAHVLGRLSLLDQSVHKQDRHSCNPQGAYKWRNVSQVVSALACKVACIRAKRLQVLQVSLGTWNYAMKRMYLGAGLFSSHQQHTVCMRDADARPGCDGRICFQDDEPAATYIVNLNL